MTRISFPRNSQALEAFEGRGTQLDTPCPLHDSSIDRINYSSTCPSFCLTTDHRTNRVASSSLSFSLSLSSRLSNRWPSVLFLLIAVRFGRVPKREKARILAAMQQSSHSRSQEKAVAAELEDEQRLLATVVQAHLDTCDFTRDKVAPILVRARETPNYTACPPTLVSIPRS